MNITFNLIILIHYNQFSIVNFLTRNFIFLVNFTFFFFNQRNLFLVNKREWIKNVEKTNKKRQNEK